MATSQPSLPAPQQDVARDAIPRSSELERTVEVIADAAAAIDEMLRYNKAMKSVASRGVAHYRGAAQDALDQAEALAGQVAGLNAEKQSLIAQYESHIDSLEALVAHQNREIEALRSLLWPDDERPAH